MDEHAEAGREQATPDGGVAAPVAGASRIASIDVLRGFALLGILVMNIPFFVYSGTAFFNPARFGGFEGLDYATWLGSHLLFEMKMMSIFSMLFGAGVVLFAEKAIAKRGRAAGLHYRRMGWLLVVGLVHAYVFWEGDILVWYALCGLVIYPARFLRARWLLLIGTVMMLVAPVLNTAQGFFFEYARAQAQEMVELREAGEEVPASVEGLGTAWLGERDEETGEMVREGMRAGFYPDEEDLEREREALLGSFVDRMAFRAPGVFFMQAYLFPMFALWRVCGIMVVGMGLYKLGVFSARRTMRFYGVLAGVGLGLGLVVVGVGVRVLHAVEFDVIAMFKYAWNFNYFGSILVALGWTGVVMLVCKAGVLGPLRSGLAAVGRMAFTNYLMQTLICSVIFFGWGLGMYGRFSRSELIPFVVGIWAFQIVFSVVWLRAFRFGPMEWAWRSLTYWRLQPMRRGGADG